MGLKNIGIRVDAFLGRRPSPQEFQLQISQRAQTVSFREPPNSNRNTASEQLSRAMVPIELPTSRRIR